MWCLISIALAWWEPVCTHVNWLDCNMTISSIQKEIQEIFPGSSKFRCVEKDTYDFLIKRK